MSRVVIRATIDDAVPYIYTREQADAIIAGYPDHEREARAKGIPTLGSGRIFPVAEDTLKVEPFPIPRHWAQLAALDFGWDHPTAAVSAAWDRDGDVFYITRAYKRKEATPLEHTAALKPWGHWLPWVWPHDGLQHDKGSGVELAVQYRNHGLRMHPTRVTFEDGTNSVEAGIMEMLERMQTGRLKVFSHLHEWFDEFRLYHRKDGKIVKEFDDVMSATRYALMGKRFGIDSGMEDFEEEVERWVGSGRNETTGY